MAFNVWVRGPLTQMVDEMLKQSRLTHAVRARHDNHVGKVIDREQPNWFYVSNREVVNSHPRRVVEPYDAVWCSGWDRDMVRNIWQRSSEFGLAHDACSSGVPRPTEAAGALPRPLRLTLSHPDLKMAVAIEHLRTFTRTYWRRPAPVTTSLAVGCELPTMLSELVHVSLDCIHVGVSPSKPNE